ncbi:MAG: hydrolase, partial [Clostridia bacterium]|nr:hydrolase [Clostridia bacterium]
CIIPVDNKGNVYLVSQYRHPFKCDILEAPAGIVEKGEDPLDCAKRELREEINAEGEEFIYLGEIYPSPGYVDEVIHLYFTKIKAFVDGQLDEDEFLTVKIIPFTKLIEMINNNDIKDAKTIIAALRVNNII